MSSNKKIFLSILVLAILLSVLFFVFANFQEKSGENLDALDSYQEISSVVVNDVYIDVEVVRSREDKAKGLSERESLGANSGMLFVFEESASHCIRMKGMNFPIDIIWIAESEDDPEEKVIVHVETNVLPESFPKVFKPRSLSDYVLEVNSGFAEKNDINIGDSVMFQ